MPITINPDSISQSILKSSPHKGKIKVVQNALKTFQNWQSDKDDFKLEAALKVIVSTDTIARQVAPELVDFLNDYNQNEEIERLKKEGDLRNANLSKWDESQIKILAIKAALFSPNTKGLKEILLKLYDEIPIGNAENEIPDLEKKFYDLGDLRLEVVKAFNKVKIDKAVINMLITALNDKEPRVRLEAAKLLKAQKIDSDEIIDAFVKQLRDEMIDTSLNHIRMEKFTNQSKESKAAEIAILEALAQMGAKAIRIVPNLVSELNTRSEFSTREHTFDPDCYIAAIKDICNAADLKLKNP